VRGKQFFHCKDIPAAPTVEFIKGGNRSTQGKGYGRHYSPKKRVFAYGNLG
jgi:hypothetical protein